MRSCGTGDEFFSRLSHYFASMKGQASGVFTAGDPSTDLIVVFEARERDTIEYVRDTVASGRKKAIDLTAHETAEEAGMDEFARWLRTIVSELPVEFIPAGDQFWRL